jgi:membrane protein
MLLPARKVPLDAASPRPGAGAPPRGGLRPADAGIVLRRALASWNRDNAPLMAAGLSFYVMLTLAPLLVVLMAVASLFLAPSILQDRLVASAAQAAGGDAAAVLREVLRALQGASAGALASVLGIGATLLAASNMILQMRYALNVVWGVPRGVATVRGFVLGRFRLLLVLAALVMVMLVWVTLDASLTVLDGVLRHALPHGGVLVQGLTFLASLGLNSVLFALIYRIVPEAGVQWRDVGLGAVVGALGFTFGKVLLGMYFDVSDALRVYGTAASLAAVLLWLYFSGLVFLFGAEMCAEWARLRGSRLGVPPIRSR